MRTILLLLAASVAPGAVPGDYAIQPRRAVWSEAQAAFDENWILPRASTAELARSPAGTRDLVADLAALLALRFETRPGDELAVAANLADLLALFTPLRRDGPGTRALLARIERERPQVWSQVAWALPHLVSESWFLDAGWDPEANSDDDGFLVVAPRDLAAAGIEPFASGRGNKSLAQVACLLRADLWAAKTCENDFRTWPRRVGVNYDWVRPRRATYLRGEDDANGPWASLSVRFRTDLPFPFSYYDCDLSMLHRLDERGHLLSHVTATGSDFYWLAGQDVYLPVVRSDGSWLAMLYVRVFGTDLRGVPDKLEHHEAGCRQGMGSLKREAEALWSSQQSAQPVREPILAGLVPDFDVWGHE